MQRTWFLRFYFDTILKQFCNNFEMNGMLNITYFQINLKINATLIYLNIFSNQFENQCNIKIFEHIFKSVWKSMHYQYIWTYFISLTWCWNMLIIIYVKKNLHSTWFRRIYFVQQIFGILRSRMTAGSDFEQMFDLRTVLGLSWTVNNVRRIEQFRVVWPVGQF